jgi:hypothetical protein
VIRLTPSKTRVLGQRCLQLVHWGSGILLAVLEDAFLLGGCSEGWIANASARLRRARRSR